MYSNTQILPGLILTTLTAVIAWLLGNQFPIVGGPIFAILLGMLLHPFVLKSMANFKAGLTFSTKKVLQTAIILLGFQMNLYKAAEIGMDSLSVMIFTLSTAFAIAYIMGRLLKMDSNMTVLIGVGTSICGGSAIAATAPIIGATDDEIAHAISTIFLFNIIAVFLFPLLGQFFGLSDYGFGVFAGTAVNDTSSVVASAASWSLLSGNDVALETATVVKLTRTLMILPISLFLSYRQLKKQKGNQVNLVKIFPWFVLGFLVTTIINTYFAIPQSLSHMLVTLGKFMIVIAMSAIGINTNLKKLILNGYKPLILGLSCWFGVTTVSLIIQNLLKLI